MTSLQPKFITGADAGSRHFRSTNKHETEELSARPGELRGNYSAQRMVMAVIIGRASMHEGICRANSGRGEDFLSRKSSIFGPWCCLANCF